MEEYIKQCMITYIGNKRKLVTHICEIVKKISNEIGKDKIDIVDGFCGSTVVARSLVQYSNNLYTNDLELYSYLMAKCFLIEPSIKDQKKIENHINKMNNLKIFSKGIISKNYAPEDLNNIKKDERCFYTPENAKIIDSMRKYIDEHVEDHLKIYCLVPLLVKSSIHTNTSGVFKGFYKNSEGVGCFGGTGQNALTRILGKIVIEMPIWHKQNINVHCYNNDIQKFVEELPEVDVVYLDPPYNQHPYGSNYFMLNVIANNIIDGKVSKVSGIPANWNKSDYNYKQKAKQTMKKLLNTLKSKTKYIILSYNNEGIITDEDWAEVFESYIYEKKEIVYNTFKGSRNLKNRAKNVMEILYLLSPKPPSKQ
jgi:adenine-specific DNA-methyltransferase